MGLLRMVALGALGYVGYRYLEQQKNEGPAAFAKGQDTGENFAKVRDAGPQAMADPPPRREWSREDEESDQSFPASDPPSNY